MLSRGKKGHQGLRQMDHCMDLRPLKDRATQSLLIQSASDVDVGIQKKMGMGTSYLFGRPLLYYGHSGIEQCGSRGGAGSQYVRLWRRLARKRPSGTTILCMPCHGRGTCIMTVYLACLC